MIPGKHWLFVATLAFVALTASADPTATVEQYFIKRAKYEVAFVPKTFELGTSLQAAIDKVGAQTLADHREHGFCAGLDPRVDAISLGYRDGDKNSTPACGPALLDVHTHPVAGSDIPSGFDYMNATKGPVSIVANPIDDTTAVLFTTRDFVEIRNQMDSDISSANWIWPTSYMPASDSEAPMIPIGVQRAYEFDSTLGEALEALSAHAEKNTTEFQNRLLLFVDCHALSLICFMRNRGEHFLSDVDSEKLRTDFLTVYHDQWMGIFYLRVVLQWITGKPEASILQGVHSLDLQGFVSVIEETVPTPRPPCRDSCDHQPQAAPYAASLLPSPFQLVLEKHTLVDLQSSRQKVIFRTTLFRSAGDGTYNTLSLARADPYFCIRTGEKVTFNRQAVEQYGENVIVDVTGGHFRTVCMEPGATPGTGLKVSYLSGFSNGNLLTAPEKADGNPDLAQEKKVPLSTLCEWNSTTCKSRPSFQLP